MFIVSAVYSYSTAAAEINVEVFRSVKSSNSGRLFIGFKRDDEEEPRYYSESPEEKDEAIFAIDVDDWDQKSSVSLGSSTKGYPYSTLRDLPSGDWYVQALFDTNAIMADINAEGNTYSEAIKVEIPEEGELLLKLEISNRIPEEVLPEGDRYLQFVKMRSAILSKFWKTDMYLRAAVLLPSSYYDDPNRRYPVFLDVGGFRGRYHRVIEDEYEVDEFKDYWFGAETPQMIIVYLDGEAPLGDSYQINSAGNGPYGDATWDEFLPHLETKFRMIKTPQGRFISGCSTGGWVTMATILFRPDHFNGAWSLSPDSPDFHHFQLVDLYEDEFAYTNEYGHERPSQRTVTGETMYTIRQEVTMESVIGRGNTYLTSSGQWGGWNAIYGPRGEDGLPVPVWDQETGAIDKKVVAHWQKYDLNRYVSDNWSTLSAKLNGKLFFWMGDMDGSYLNNGLRSFEDTLQELTDPVSRAVFEWKAETDHCDFEIIDMRKKIINEMMIRYEKTK